MKPAIALIVLFPVSCAGPQVSPEVKRIVPLIKAERYDEAAADPDLLAPAFAEALRQLQADGADPKHIVRIAEFFFDHYPFAIRDVAVDEALFETVAEVHFQASTKLKPALSACAKLAAAKTAQDKIRLLRTWDGAHDDGGRCARNVAEFLRRMLKAGPEWDYDPALSRSGRDGSPSVLTRDLVEACETFEASPHFLVAAMTASRVNSFYGEGRMESWGNWDLTITDGRWRRLFRARLSWWDALRQRPQGYLRSEPFEASPFDPRLRDLGAALKAALKIDFGLESECKDMPGLLQAMEEVIRAGRGTPYPDLFRYLYVVAWVNAERSDAAEKWLQVHEREFDNPFRRAYSWLFLVMPYLCDGTVTQNSDRVLHLARAAMEAGPGVSSSGEALVLMARIHKAKGRVAEAVACLEKAVSIPDDACGPFEDESARYARSDAGNLLASLYLEQKEWSKSLACWKAWNPYPMCANELWDQDLEVSLGVGRCLEELDRLREAADHYWSSVLNIRYSDSPAQRLVAVHRSLGTLEELKDKVRVKAYASDEFIPEGVKSLADDLGVTPK